MGDVLETEPMGVCVCVCVCNGHKEIYCKELTHMIMEADKF